MKRGLLVHSVGLGVFFSMLGLCSGQAFGMGTKRQVQDLQSASAELIQEIRADQEKIVVLDDALDAQNKDRVPGLPDLSKLSVTDLLNLEKEQKARIEELDRRMMAQAETKYADLGSQNDLVLTGGKFQPSRCANLHDQLNNYAPVVEGRRKWALKCLNKHLEDVKNRSEDFYLKNGYHDPALQDEYDRTGMSVSVIGFAGAFDASIAGFPGRYFYPTFGTYDEHGQLSNPGCPASNPKCQEGGRPKPYAGLPLLAPINEDAPCDVSYVLNPGQEYEGDQAGNDPQVSQVPVDLFNDVHYHLVALCVSGCYTPDQSILFQGGYKEIGQAFADRNLEVTTLSSDSSLEHPKFQSNPIDAYTVDIAPSTQEVLDFETASGKRLSVTRNHPLLDSTGMMREAESFEPGQSLVQADGSPDPIVKIAGRNYFGKVYNFGLRNSDLIQNIVVAQGLLSGSVFYQNEGTKYLNRALFRMNLPRSILP